MSNHNELGEIVCGENLFEKSHHRYDKNLPALRRLADAASRLPSGAEFNSANNIFRGTLLRRLIFDRNFQIIGNEPTELTSYLNATEDRQTAENYARSYGDPLAPVKLRVDPVVIVFDRYELRQRMRDQGRRWFISKSVLRSCSTSLYFPGRDPEAEAVNSRVQKKTS